MKGNSLADIRFPSPRIVSNISICGALTSSGYFYFMFWWFVNLITSNGNVRQYFPAH
jgi:hypothetical protein